MVQIIGHLGRDPETKQFPNGGSATNFSVATTEHWTDKNTGEKKERTEWHNVSVKDRMGENCQKYLTSGSKVYIQGKLRTRKYNSQSGDEKSITEIHAEEVKFLDSSNQSRSNSNNSNQNTKQSGNSNQGQQKPPAGNYGNQGQQNRPAGNYSNQGQQNRPAGSYGNQGQGLPPSDQDDNFPL